jgi:hypothetical protein
MESWKGAKIDGCGQEIARLSQMCSTAQSDKGKNEEKLIYVGAKESGSNVEDVGESTWILEEWSSP